MNTKVNRILWPAILFIVLVALWALAVRVFDVKAYILPSPSDVLDVFVTESQTLKSATLATAAAAGLGFLISVIAGVSIAILFSQSALIRMSCYPYAIFLQTMPIVAVAPLIVLWFGFGFQSVTTVVVIISLFPIITNATTGMTSLEQGYVELFELYNASRWQLLFNLRLPNAVPHIVTGARISSGLAVVGAIVGEFFAGASDRLKGLGYYVQSTGLLLKTDMLFACIFLSAALGVVLFLLVSLISRGVLRKWTFDLNKN